MRPSPKINWNPDRLDVRAFAQAGASLGDEAEPLVRFERLRDEAVAADGAVETLSVQWLARGETRPAAAGAAPSIWLHLSGEASVPLRCQRCLGAVQTPLVVDRWFRFVADEAAAAAEDEDCEEDVLALEPRPNLRELLEDEFLMALPLVPMHGTCPEPVVMQAGELAPDALPTATEAGRPNPFASLARLKK